MKILHTGIILESYNTVHVRLRIYQGSAYPDSQDIRALTRGLSGTITIDTKHAEQFIHQFTNLVHFSFDDRNQDLPQWVYDTQVLVMDCIIHKQEDDRGWMNLVNSGELEIEDCAIFDDDEIPF